MSIPARDLARLSALIYEPWPIVDDMLADYRFVKVASFDHAGTQGLLVRAPAPDRSPGQDWAALVFRGTEASKVRVLDLIANFGVPVAWAGRGRAHSGYLRAFNRISYSARRMAEDVADEIPLYATGHSMGGCLATLFASWLYTERPHYRLAGLVTFGAPKALSWSATTPIRCPILRYWNDWDPAPLWPPVPGLTHPCPAWRIDSGGSAWPISRHDIDNYVASLERG